MKQIQQMCMDGVEITNEAFAELAAKFEGVSHGVCHRLVEAVLRLYFFKWFNALPSKYQLVYGRISIEVSADADLSDVEVQWDGAYGCMMQEDCVVSVPHDD